MKSRRRLSVLAMVECRPVRVRSFSMVSPTDGFQRTRYLSKAMAALLFTVFATGACLYLALDWLPI